MMRPQHGVGPVHVADDDGDVLEPLVVGAGIDRNGPAPRGEILGQFQHLGAQPEPHDAQTHAENADEVLMDSPATSTSDTF